MIYCLFEQSGTFKNEFLKLNLAAVDVDILNNYNSTDIVCDLFSEINNAFDNLPSFFDNVKSDDFIFAFFPCDCFSSQFRLKICSNQFQLLNSSVTDKLLNSLNCHEKLNLFYSVFCKFFYILYSRGFQAAVENPFHDSYLNNFFPIKPTLIDMDRRLNGDFYKKPTQYFFINFEPKNNVIFEAFPSVCCLNIKHGYLDKMSRSLINPVYANRFIRQFIVSYDGGSYYV